MKYQNKMVLYSLLYVAFPLAALFLIYDLFAQSMTRFGFYLFFLFLSFLLGVCIVVISRFDRHAGILEKAARRIAEGDLDYTLDPAERENEFSGLTRSFERMRVSLKEEQAKRFRFLMAVSHDLNTPLTSIKGYLEAMQDGLAEEPEQRRKYLEIMTRKSELLELRIQELIDFVKTETGDWRMKAEKTLLYPFFSDLGSSYEHEAEVNRREFQYSIDLPEDVYLLADRPLLIRVFENLFSNAFRYTSPGDRIYFDVHSSGKEVLASIKDTGIGIPSEQLPFIFDPFFRGSSSRREEGHGLGLSTVKNILRSHDWSIEVFSTLGKGTEFIIHMAPYFYGGTVLS